MDLGKYLLSVTAAALLASVVTSLLGDRSTIGAVVKMLSGIYLTLAILVPLCQLRLNEITDLKSELTTQAQQIAIVGQNAARDAMAESIIASTQTYILDKANSMGIRLTVEVELDDSPVPVPCSIRIKGNISPYQKEKLSVIIQQDLGIPSEAQLWI